MYKQLYIYISVYINKYLINYIDIYNHILLKEDFYPLVIILGDLIAYKNNIIDLKIGPMLVNIKIKDIIINFNILLLGRIKWF